MIYISNKNMNIEREKKKVNNAQSHRQVLFCSTSFIFYETISIHIRTSYIIHNILIIIKKEVLDDFAMCICI